MAALTVDTPRDYGVGGPRSVNDLPVKAASTIYEGSYVGDDASGYARALVAADPFLGIAWRKADNSAGADGAIRVKLIERGEIKAAVVGATGVGDVGDKVYASDSGTLTKTAGSNTEIGKIKRYIGSPSSTYCEVEFAAVQVRNP